MLIYSILNKNFKINNLNQKIQIFNNQYNYKSIFKIKVKFKKFIVNKSSFKYKKSREQYAISIVKKKWSLVDKTIIPKIFEFFFYFINFSTNQFLKKIQKLEFFKY
jgi:hypothetical protein